MAFWKRIQMKINKKWYPKSVLVGSPVSTEQLCKRIGAESTVSPADVRAVLTALAPIMADYMSQGRSVKLDGIGSRRVSLRTDRVPASTPPVASLTH